MGVDKHEGDSLSRQAKRSYEHKDDGTGSKLFNTPSGVKIFKWEKDTKYRHLIVAWPAGENHPLVKSGDFRKGEYVYSIEFHVHKGMGVDEKGMCLCLKHTFNKKCPICEYMDEMADKGRKDIAEKIKAKKQTAYIVYDIKEGKEVFYILSQPHFSFEKGMIEAARTAADDDEDLVGFPYRDKKGCVIKYMVKEETFNSRKFLKLADGTSFKPISKEDDLPLDFLNKPFCLDEFLKIPSYDEAQKMLYSNDDDDDEKPEQDEKKEDDEEPVKKDKKKETSTECPQGHKFGTDNDEFEDDCDDCKVYVACARAKKGK
jgi:hypothetical protein